jgi:divalent metal cation (Fe/Co/Zn/Cd) transporter
VEKCLVRKTGFEYFVDLHMLVPDALTVTEGHAIAHTVKAAIQRQKPAIYNVLIHVEPDLKPVRNTAGRRRSHIA